jgi:ABC-type glycerol-3-phosphate transport system substrate-binding protein
MKIKLLVMAPLAAALLLTACGGGGSDNGPAAEADNSVPASALASAESFSRWVGNIRPSESMAPLLLMMGLVLPTTETGEPIEVN